MSRKISEAGPLPDSLPNVTLAYAQVTNLLLRLGYGDGVTENTFREYLKSLRKLGIPLGDRVNRQKKHFRARYTYYHIMELALVQCLRVYHVVPDAVLNEVSKSREDLYELYRRAYVSRSSGQSVTLFPDSRGMKRIELRGLFLDLNIKFSGGKMTNFGPPRLLSSADAVARFAQHVDAGEFFWPINLSRLAEQVVTLALSLPRKGR